MNALERWDAFLSEVASRHAQLAQEAGEIAFSTIVKGGLEPITEAWNEWEKRLVEMEDKILSSWNEKVEPAFIAEAYSPEVCATARDKGADLAFSLENEREAAKQRLFGECARRLRAHGSDPEKVLALGAHAWSWERAHEHWITMRHADRAVREMLPPCPLALLKAYERAQIAYLRVYITARSAFQPELANIPYEVRSRMEQWYRFSAEEEEEWVRAGRPRETI